ncbi:MAG: hypothetical protein HY652_02700, partial [Acidobacteria bacterium]|nr:hypothetical protein [Acidobacteriota bacterium]
MVPMSEWQRKAGRRAFLVMTVVMAGWLLSGREVGRGDFSRASQAGAAKVPGHRQLISYQPLPEIHQATCDWEPGGVTALAAEERGPFSAFAAPASRDARAAEPAKRPPLRVIRDAYAAFSSVAVDLLYNEVVFTDENLFQILTFNRLENTPPRAAMSEPKRIIGGLKTKIEFQCGLYVDPKSGDIYAVNNDTVDTLVIFSRRAKGDVPPDRELYTPHGTFGIAVDEQRQELFLTVQHDNAVVVFHKMAQEDDPPIRLLQGDRTGLADPHGIALDTKNNLIFVTNHGSVHQVRPGPGRGLGRQLGRGRGKPNWPLGFDHAVPGSGKILPPSITVYPRDASGDTAPLRVIRGPKTQMNWPSGIAVDPERGELFVANDAGDSMLVFSASASGNVA